MAHTLRLDPNISPKRAARILANRISAAKSKNKKREMQAQMQARCPTLLSRPLGSPVRAWRFRRDAEMVCGLRRRLNKMRQVAEVMRAEHTTLVTGILGLEAEYQQLEGLIAQLQLQSTQLDAKKQQLEARGDAGAHGSSWGALDSGRCVTLSVALGRRRTWSKPASSTCRPLRRKHHAAQPQGPQSLI